MGVGAAPSYRAGERHTLARNRLTHVVLVSGLAVFRSSFVGCALAFVPFTGSWHLGLLSCCRKSVWGDVGLRWRMVKCVWGGRVSNFTKPSNGTAPGPIRMFYGKIQDAENQRSRASTVKTLGEGLMVGTR